jgi:hypothetical protein
MRTRKYTTLGAGKLRQLNVLVSWSQRTCILCHKFLSKHQQKYCTKCYNKYKHEQDRLHQIEYRKRKGHREKAILYAKEYYKIYRGKLKENLRL